VKKACAFALAVCLLFVVQLRGETYRLVVVPDTQFASQKWPEVLDSSMKWIAQNKDAMNIKYVLHVGDMVDSGNDPQQWKNFDAAIGILDGKVPYILSPGNHDYDSSDGKGDLKNFNEHHPVERFKKLPSFGGNFPKGTNNNSYHTFSAGPTDWLIVALSYDPADDELDWADKVVSNHPKRQVIVLTHSYLNNEGRSSVGENIWKKLASRHENIMMVICGHLHTTHYEDTGLRGNKVYQMLFDWQNSRAPESNSYIGIIELDPDAGTISIKSYSPMLKKYKTDPLGQFEFTNVKFMRKGEAVSTQ
jgi:predicted MPP superfamily phosphohydrolase